MLPANSLSFKLHISDPFAIKEINTHRTADISSAVALVPPRPIQKKTRKVNSKHGTFNKCAKVQLVVKMFRISAVLQCTQIEREN